MTESENDIEFLDEDADIVQKCVQVQTVQYVKSPQLEPVEDQKLTPLLVERWPVEKETRPVEKETRRKRRRVAEDDSDYDPSEDLVPQSPPPSPKAKKKKQQSVSKKIKTYQKEVPILKVAVKPKPIAKTPKDLLLDRKQLNIKIPDYEDPLCLPVKAIKQDNIDIKRLNNWNNVCLEHFKHCDNMLKPEKGETNSSTRTVVFRNVVNKQSGNTDTTIWSKTCVENIDGDRKSEIFQCVLPRYKERKVLSTFTLAARKPKSYHMSDEVILCNEDSKDGEVLVVYKGKESLSAVYKLTRTNDNKDSKEDSEEKEDEDVKMYMKEILCCKMCVSCFQTSWRGIKKEDKKSMSCPICKRSSLVNAYNLLTHLKTHSAEEVRKYKSVISSVLAQTVDYLYKCRTCREHFSSIKRLRQHLSSHRGFETFTCEVCNRITT